MRDDDPDGKDIPASSGHAAMEGVTAAGTNPPGSSSSSSSVGGGGGGGGGGASGRPRLAGAAGAAGTAIFREVVLAKVREKKAEQEAEAGRASGMARQEERR